MKRPKGRTGRLATKWMPAVVSLALLLAGCRSAPEPLFTCGPGMAPGTEIRRIAVIATPEPPSGVLDYYVLRRIPKPAAVGAGLGMAAGVVVLLALPGYPPENEFEPPPDELSFLVIFLLPIYLTAYTVQLVGAPILAAGAGAAAGGGIGGIGGAMWLRARERSVERATDPLWIEAVMAAVEETALGASSRLADHVVRAAAPGGAELVRLAQIDPQEDLFTRFDALLEVGITHLLVLRGPDDYSLWIQMRSTLRMADGGQVLIVQNRPSSRGDLDPLIAPRAARLGDKLEGLGRGGHSTAWSMIGRYPVAEPRSAGPQPEAIRQWRADADPVLQDLAQKIVAALSHRPIRKRSLEECP